MDTATITPRGAANYTYDVTNTGNTPLQNVDLEDTTVPPSPPACDPIVRGADGPGNNDAILDVGETWHFTCSNNPVEGVVDTATVSGVPVNPVTGDPFAGRNPPVNASDSASVLTRQPGHPAHQVGQPDAGRGQSWRLGGSHVHVHRHQPRRRAPEPSRTRRPPGPARARPSRAGSWTRAATSRRPSPAVTPTTTSSSIPARNGPSPVLTRCRTTPHTRSSTSRRSPASLPTPMGTRCPVSTRCTTSRPPSSGSSRPGSRSSRPRSETRSSTPPLRRSPARTCRDPRAGAVHVRRLQHRDRAPGRSHPDPPTDTRCTPLVPANPLGDDGNGLLDPGEVWHYTCETTLSLAVANGAGDVVNTVTATGIPDVDGTQFPDLTRDRRRHRHRPRHQARDSRSPRPRRRRRSGQVET